jgi:4-amino-4-deoxy-L-arabinose transferase-like glycosyltransferase
LGVLVGLALSGLASILAAALIPDSAGWVQEEAGLWLSALLALGVTVFWYTTRGAAAALPRDAH